MPTWAWILIVIAIVVVAAVVWRALVARRTGRLQEQFGSEYDRTVEGAGSRKDAESELEARAERRQQLDIRPLAPAARERHLQTWQTVQAQFVDDPRAAVSAADSLIQTVMAERGYPVEDFEQRAADVSVDHPDVVENYRAGHRLAQSGDQDGGETEALRQAMQHFRSLFDELLGDPADAPTARGTADDAYVDGSRLVERRPKS